jgi:hypothetical protein
VIWGDFPCVYWRHSRQNVPRPDYEAFEGIPTFVLNAEADPITPIWGARAVFEHLEDGYMITQKGGPHVIFGRGQPCIDNPVTEFLVNDVLPPRETYCGGKLVRKYIPLAPLYAAEFPNLIAAFQSAETEINWLPEYFYWDFAETIRVGCSQSGWIEYRPDGDQTRLAFDNCSFSRGLAMTGIGSLHYDVDRFALLVDLTGNQTCSARYIRTDGNTSLSGNCQGIPLNETGTVDVSDFERPDPRERRRMVRSR